MRTIRIFFREVPPMPPGSFLCTHLTFPPPIYFCGSPTYDARGFGVDARVLSMFPGFSSDAVGRRDAQTTGRQPSLFFLGKV